MNLIAIAGAIVFALLAIIGYQHWRINGLQEKGAKYELAVKTYEAANKTNQVAVKDCEAAAAKNFALAERNKRNVEEAARRSEARANRLAVELEKLNAKANDLRTRIVGTCVAADDPAFIEFLCSGPLGCPGD